MSFNIWQDQGVVIAAVGGDRPGQPNVIFEGNAKILSGNVFKMWFGTTNGVCYAESSNGISWTRYTSNPVVSTPGVEQFCRLTKQGSTYYLYTGAITGSISCYTSTDGITFTLANATALSLSQSWENDGVFQLSVCEVDSNGKWWAYYSSVTASLNYQQGLATSTDGINWVKDPGNPINAPYLPSNFCFQQINGVFYAWTQMTVPNIPGYGSLGLPNDISRYQSGGPGGPWTALPNGTPTLYRTTAGEGVGTTVGQVADPSILSVGGTIYLFYSIVPNGTGSTNEQIELSTAPATTFAQLVSSYEGVVDVPIPWGNPGTPLNLSAATVSDNFQRANSNPIGGNWTQFSSNAGQTGVQLVSNTAEPTNTGLNGEVYWNANSFPNDQWGQVVVSAFSGTSSFISVSLRMNTSGVQTCYRVTAQGSSSTYYIQRFVNGTDTTLLTASTGTNFAPGDVITGCVVGSQISMYQNGNLLGTVNDSTIASGAVGFVVNSSPGVTNASISSWSSGGFQSASASPYSIYGNAGIAGATVSYSGPTSGSVMADSLGNYVIPSLIAGTYTIIPSLSGYLFSPPSQVETISISLGGVNFIATTISSETSIQMTQFQIQQIVNQGLPDQRTLILRDFGISVSNPSEIDSFSSSTQVFIQPGPLPKPLIATPDGWANFGQEVNNGQLLLGPIASGFVTTQSTSVVTSGTASIPTGVPSPTLIVTLYQNVFTTVHGVIQHQQIPYISTAVPVVAGSVVPWSLRYPLFSSTNQPYILSVGIVLQHS